MRHDFDIIIVGGGLVGCAFALDLALQQPKFSIGILEQKPYTEPDLTKLDNKIYAIAPNNVEYLSKLGVWSDSKVGTIKTMDVSGDINSNIILDNKSAKQLYLAKTIEYNNLQHQLYTKLNMLDNVNFIYDELSKINYKNDYVELIGQHKNYKVSLVVGADGANSFVRKEAKIELEQVNYPEYGVVANFKCEYPHNNVAYQWFSNDGVLAYLPMEGNQISIVWASKNHKQLVNLSDEELATAVAAAGNNKLGSLKVITKAVGFPLRLYLLKQVYANKTVLIGDAAHTIHPLAGQGVNLGFGDAKLLASILANCQKYQIGDSAILSKFNSLRSPHVQQMQLICHFLYRLFAINNPLIMQLRNQGLNWVNSLPLVKNYLIRKAISY